MLLCVKTSPRLLLPTSVARVPILPVRLKAGNRSAFATPICADCAAACSSACLTSGLRRSKSAGIPTITCSGAVGISEEPVSKSSSGAVLELRAGNLQRRALACDVVAGDGHLPFNGADFHVGAGYIADQGNQHVVVVGDRGQERGVGGFDGAAKFTPEIQFPCRLAAKLVDPIGVGNNIVWQR